MDRAKNHTRIYTPLLFFQSDIENIKLNDSDLIRPAKESEINFLRGKYPNVYNSNEIWILESKMFERKMGNMENYFNRHYDLARKLLTKGVNILQIFQRGNLTSCTFFWPLSNNTNNYSSIHVHTQFPWSLPRDDGPYILKRKDILTLSKFWIRTHSKIEFFEVPVHYFSKHYFEPHYMDKIIDLVICLENMLTSKQDGSRNLGYKIAKRCANLLTKKKINNSWNEIYETIRFSYNIRNDIIHGNEIPKLSVTKWVTNTKRMRKITRRTLNYFLRNDSKYGDNKFLKTLILE